ncbi:MAG TPA: DUF4364 family protein [Tissierellaceae bacterium]
MPLENTEELAQNKLLLLYIIKFSNHPFTNNELTEFVLKKNYMNYFFIQQYLSELMDSNFIGKVNDDSKEVYKLLEKGEVALSYFEDRIPNSIKEELDREFNRFKIENKKKTQVVADYYPKENNLFSVNLKLVENEDVLFSLYFDVASKEQAEIICEKWKKETEYIYKNIIDLLTENI